MPNDERPWHEMTSFPDSHDSDIQVILSRRFRLNTLNNHNMFKET